MAAAARRQFEVTDPGGAGDHPAAFGARPAQGYPVNAPRDVLVKPLRTNSAVGPVKVKNVQLLGFKGKLEWRQDGTGLKVQVPADKPCDYAATLKITEV